MWIKILRIQYILWRRFTTESMVDVANMLKKITVKHVPINNHELLNIQACSFDMFWEHEKQPICSGKLQVLNSSSKIH